MILDKIRNRRLQRRALAIAIIVGSLNLVAFRPRLDLPEGKPSNKIASETLRRAEELRRQWKLDAAEAAFAESAKSDSVSLEANLGLARIARVRFGYARALSLLNKIEPQSAEVIDEYGLIYLAAEETTKARSYFERALNASSTDAQAEQGLAAVEIFERDYQKAEQRLGGCLDRDPNNSSARALLARVYLETNQPAPALKEADRALQLDGWNVDALYVLAFAKSVLRNSNEARIFAGRAVALDQFNIGARRLLSQYVDGEAGYEQRIAEPARLHYERGKARRQGGDLEAAAAEFNSALAIEPRYYRALIAAGDVCLRNGEYERAVEFAGVALSVDPDGALAHLELSCAYRGVQDRARIEIGAVDFNSSLSDIQRFSSYAATREIFPEYRALNKRQQAVIDWAVSQLASWLPTLSRRKARHYLLGYDQRPSDLRGFGDVADEKTFDGRYYDSLRGVGGRVALSGIEYLDQAARGGFNTIAHEFAHQVHIAALGKKQVREIRSLYERARRENRTLDYYAAANEYEYFAQGYEAFISERKRPSAGVTGRHTRSELARCDPGLYNFLITLTGGAGISGSSSH